MPEYKGDTFVVPVSRGGLNGNPNEDLVPPEGMVDAKNLNLDQGGRETRGGVEKVNSTPISGSPKITGLIQFRLISGSSFIVTGMTDGKVYKDYTTLLHTFATTGQKISFTVFNDTLYIWNGANLPQTWDGAAGSTSDLANPAADWTGTNYPKAAIVHGRGAARHIWAYGAPLNLEDIYVPGTAGSDDFTTGVIKMTVDTEDGFGVEALVRYAQELVAIGRERPYPIDDTNADTSKWGYNPARWEGGVAHERLLVKTPNDLIAMQEDGEIYSVARAQASGDFEASSIARPAFIHSWIKNNIDLSKIADFHMIYDRGLRAIRIFMVRTNQTLPDTSLIYFIDRPVEEAWVEHRYYKTPFAACAAVVRVAAGDWRVYTGGQTGHVYKLESSTILDDGDYFYNGFTGPELPFNDPRGEKMYDRNWLVARIIGDEVIKENLYIDGVPISGGFNLVDELGNGIIDENSNQIVGNEFDSFTFDLTPAQALSRANRLNNVSHPVGRKGIRVQSEVFNTASGERMFISQQLYDHTPLGRQVT